jgi:FAD-dependent oxidoreductase domain-containing protein 1
MENLVENGMVHYDVLVIGAGIIGLSTAYHIKQRNPALSVLVVDGNAASAQGETAKSLAGVRDCFTSDINRLLASSTIEFYKYVQSQLNFNLNLELIGYLWLYTEAEFSNFELVEGAMKDQGVRFRVWERSELRRMIPDLVLDPRSQDSRIIGLESVYKGVQGLNCGTVSPELVAKFYENEFRKLGGKLQFGCEVKRLQLVASDSSDLPGGPHIWQEKKFKGVQTSRGSLSAETLVLATGVRTPVLLDPIGIDCLAKPKKRQIFKVSGKPVERLMNSDGFNRQDVIPLTILPKAGVHFRPVRNEKSLWVAAADVLGRAFRLEDEPAAEEAYYTYGVYPILSEYFPCFRDLRPASSWAGHYDVNSLDGAPVIDRIANCVVVVGMSGSGIMKADGIGRVAAAVFQKDNVAELFGGAGLSASRLGLTNRAVEKETLIL